MRSFRLHFLALILAAAWPLMEALAHADTHKDSGAPVVKEQKTWGIAGDAKPGLRAIRVSMNDRMRFVPDAMTITEGETVRIVVKNDGKLMHEFVLGTRETHEEHAALMVRFPTMEHDEPYMVHVAPGKTGEIVWTFNRVGEFAFACLIAGHYQAGMVGKVHVVPRPKGSSALR
ncbi:MAG: cupredoxin domain-containing protein [Burkholderiaceae bacterium]